jgi:hypothetical protein
MERMADLPSNQRTRRIGHRSWQIPPGPSGLATPRHAHVGAGAHRVLDLATFRADAIPMRYNRAVRLVKPVAFVFLAFVVACGNPPKKPVVPMAGSGTPAATNGGTPPAGITGGGAIAPAPKPGGGGSTVPAPVTLKTVGCPVPSCVMHPAHGTYFTCMNGGAGTCFHFGGPCIPDKACMYDAASNSYKTCTKPGEGTCQAWGAACAPANRCMFQVADNLHHTCDDLSGGTCKKFGALCAP